MTEQDPRQTQYQEQPYLTIVLGYGVVCKRRGSPRWSVKAGIKDSDSAQVQQSIHEHHCVSKMQGTLKTSHLREARKTKQGSNGDTIIGGDGPLQDGPLQELYE